MTSRSWIPIHVICHLDEEAELSMEMTVKTGRGYVPAAHEQVRGRADRSDRRRRHL